MIKRIFFGSRGGERAIVNCQCCGGVFDVPTWKFKTGRAKYCSRSCKSKDLGVKNYRNLRPEQKQKLATLASIRLRQTRLKQASDESLQPHWMGSKVGYSGLHSWVTRRKGRARYCSFANSITHTCRDSYEWANISHEYKRDLNDWMPLCQKCHRRYDNNGVKIWITRRKNGNVKWKKV